MPITFRLHRSPTVPLEAELISPDVTANLSNAEIRGLTVYHGRRKLTLSDFFDVEGERSTELVLHGAMERVRRIGCEMSQGSITVHGDVGMHLGAQMRGGRIEVFGNADDWVGAEMKHGFIHVHGNAGGQVGAAYRGSPQGMKDGVIVVDGSAGREVGMRMRRGVIVVGGPTRDFAGLQMKGGTLVLLGGSDIRTGAWMNRGTILSLKPLPLLPTFRRTADANPVFVRLLMQQLRPFGVNLPFAAAEGCYQTYSGDLSVSHRGEILVWQPTK